jgi:hypothetical protein
MKRIPAGLLLLTLVFAPPALPRLHAEDESAAQLEQQDLGPDQNMSDESAAQLSNKDVGPDQSMKDESAAQLSNKDVGPDQSMKDESASKLSNKDLGPDQSMKDESAAKLAVKDGEEKKPKVVSSNPPSSMGVGEGVDGVIYATTSLPDGSVVVGGNFDTVNGQPRQNLAVFKPDGSLDGSTFASATTGVDGTVYALATDAKGNVLVGGYFTVNTDQGDPLQNFVRFLAGGKLDTAFTAGLSPNGAVYAITVQPKGSIVVGGEFTQAGPQPRKNLVRYNADGTLDGPVGSASASTGSVRSLAVLTNGGVFAAGSFEVAGQNAKNVLVAP